MNLSKHFSLEEMVKSDTAVRLAIKNEPQPWHIDNMRKLCEYLLEPLRKKLNDDDATDVMPARIHVNSGYRSIPLNTAVGGANKSQHTMGMAADIHVEGITTEELYQFIKVSGLPFDQLIQEFNAWVHVSFSAMNRKQCLRAIKVSGHTEQFAD